MSIPCFFWSNIMKDLKNKTFSSKFFMTLQSTHFSFIAYINRSWNVCRHSPGNILISSSRACNLFKILWELKLQKNHLVRDEWMTNEIAVDITKNYLYIEKILLLSWCKRCRMESHQQSHEQHSMMAWKNIFILSIFTMIFFFCYFITQL